MPIHADTRDKNIALFHKYIEYENARDYKRLEALFHPAEFVCHTWFGNHPIAPEALTRMLKGLFRAFPDWYMTVNEIIAADDEAVSGRITGRGTQAEEFMGRPPADHQIAIPLIHTIRVQHGKIIAYRATNPFDDPFQADIVAPEDVQASRAQQGTDDAQLHRVLDAAVTHGVSTDHVATLRRQFDTHGTVCQVLLKKNMRRCQMPAVTGTIYCTWHHKHGYGVDGL